MSGARVAEQAGGTAPGAGVPVIGRALPWVLTLGGAIGLAAAAALLVEKIRVLQDPGHVPSCSINPVLSCGTLHNLRTRALPAAAGVHPLLNALARNHTVVPTVWALAIAAAITQAFWTYWSTLL
ncbi:vitamin K epoxide reductase family protein [Nocardiopsis mangrovi]|uniref:Vitamin K epoxide reductase family protein n=1 Tax=Nocardiopsis mangrovi TaxID=1179818 RepID=A0ABV9E213_9ACTN